MSTSPSQEPVANGTANGPAATPNEPALRLDVKKLHSLSSEQQDLYLFNFSAELEEYVSSLTPDQLTAQQSPLNDEIFQIIELDSPKASKAVRQNIGRALALILGKGSRRTLFECVNKLTSIITAAKGEQELSNKHAAVYCLGEVYRAAGESAINLSSLACSTLLKLLKPFQNAAGARAAVFQALGKLVGAIENSVDDVLARDIWKQARKAAGDDKTALVQARACGCLEALLRHTKYFDTTSYFEELRSAIWKASECTVASTRRAAASCLSAVLIKSYSEEALSRSSAKSKKKKTVPQLQDDGVDGTTSEPGRPTSPSGSKKAPEKLELSMPDILWYLGAKYTLPSTSNRTRSTLAHCYIAAFQGLGLPVVERWIGGIIEHFFTDILSNSFIVHERHRLLITRNFVSRILDKGIAESILGEAGRLNMSKILLNTWLKNYPQVVKELPAPSKHALVGALNTLSFLIQSLGSAFTAHAEKARDALVQVLQHPSYTVQIHTSSCLRALTLACPQQLLPGATICMNSVTRELKQIASVNAGRGSLRRCLGYAYGLSAVISVSPQQPLYGSLEINSKILTVATDLLKSSSQADLRIAGTQVHTAWILIGSLMTLGPNFVKIHLPQFLLLWRNALPPPLTKENFKQRQAAEVHYLASIRDYTLDSILLFLEFNRKLVTQDVAKRIGALLQNTAAFLDSVPSRRLNEDLSQKTVSSLSIQDLVLMVRRRLFQCYSKLLGINAMGEESLSQSNLLSSAVALIADPSGYAPGSLSTSIGNTSATFESIWEISDNSAFGLTGIVRKDQALNIPGEEFPKPITYDYIDHFGVDALLQGPICGAKEHDALLLHSQFVAEIGKLPDPPATDVVNHAISLFATSFPLQSSKLQEGLLEQLATFLSAPSLAKDPGRRAAVTINIAMALLSIVKIASGESEADKGDIKSQMVGRLLQELLHSLLMHGDATVRRVAYEAMGRLCNILGNSFTSTEVDGLIETIVSNRNPHARAGYAMALGAIHEQVGGMAAGLHIKKIHGILMSLCGDPSPVVHHSAVKALSQVADSAGLAFSASVPSTLGLLTQLWTSDSHNEESVSATTSNMESENPTAIVLAHTVDSLVNVLGPDLQDMNKVRELMLVLMHQFSRHEIWDVQAECLKIWGHYYLYDPMHMDLAAYVTHLQCSMDSPIPALRNVAIDGLYTLIRRDAHLITSIGGQRLEDQIWSSLNENPEHDGLKNIIETWLVQTSLGDTDKWITRAQLALTKTVKDPIETSAPTKSKPPAVPDLQDEEVAGFNVGDGKDQVSGSLPEAAQEYLRWQVRSFAIKCLNDVVAIIKRDMEADPKSEAGQILESRIADVVRLAFLASTAPVVEIQVGGLQIIDQILKIFGSTPDPDFSEALLLEQYQAQISSALTPAFAADSPPDLASAAVNVCATFIAAGLVTDIDRMGRILKLLVSALENITEDKQESALGDLRGLSSNAQTMIKVTVLAAWAHLQTATTQQEYLQTVVRPYVTKLTPLWLSSLKEFARLRFEPDITSSTGPPSPNDSLDVVYASLNRETLLKFYQASWLKMIEAIASLIDQGNDIVYDALDGGAGSRKEGEKKPSRHDMVHRQEPSAFFFVLYGITTEALISQPQSSGSSPVNQLVEVLSVLNRILRPSVAGTTIFQDVVFSETIELFDRLALTESLEVQLVVVDIARNLCNLHPSARRVRNNEEGLSEDDEQLFELTRIIVMVLAGLLPNLAEQSLSARQQIPEEGIKVIRSALEALVDAADIFPSVIKYDLHASIFHIFATILATGTCQANVMPHALPILKRFLRRLSATESGSKSTSALVRGCLYRFMGILVHAQRRESDSSLACAKNVLLASTILLSTSSSCFVPNEPLVSRAQEAILECLQDVGLGKVAANCLKILLLVNPKNATDEAMAHALLPRLLQFVVDQELPDPEDARPVVAQALTSFVVSQEDQRAAAGMGIVLPALLTRAAAKGKPVYGETAQRLLELAGGQLTPYFRGVLGSISPQQKAFLERVIRDGGGIQGTSRRDRSESDTGEEPTIALKMNFGA